MKKIINILIISLTVILYASCTPEENDIFPESSANRIAAALKADKDILTSAKNGWLIEYYPSSSQAYGGFNLLALFTEDGKVTIAGDIANPDNTAISTYNLIQSAGPVLTFDTYNEILHFFSDPKNPSGIGTNGKGMEGDHEFLIMEASKDKVILQGRKTLNRIEMTPVAADLVWKDYIASIQELEEAASFGVYAYIVDKTVVSVSTNLRNLSMSYEEDGELKEIGVPYIVTPTGFKFYRTLDIGGVPVDELIYKESEKALVSPDGKAKLIFPPAILSGKWYMAYSQLGAYGKQCWDIVNAGNPDEDLYYVYLNEGNLTFGWNPRGTTSLYSGTLGLSSTFDDSHVTFSYNGVNAGNGNYYMANVEDFSYILYPFEQVTFTITMDDPEHPTKITLQDVDDPTNTIVLSNKVIYYPSEK